MIAAMPRTARRSLGGVVYHALNRGNGRQRLFHKPADYDAFVALLAEVKKAVPGVLLLAYCLMPNHWHLVLLPRRDGELSRFMQRLLTAHVRRHHAHRRTAGSGGHLYQGRFKSFPVQDDRHLLAVCRYVESNPLRAGMVGRAQDWPHSSLRWSAGLTDAPPPVPLAPWPVERPADWLARVNEPINEDDLARLRCSARRGRPFGDEAWTRRTANLLGLTHTLRDPGRPKKPRPKEQPATRNQ